MPPKAPAKKDSKSAKTTSSKSGSGGKAKKKWSKGKVKDKANNAVVFDKATYDKVLKEVPTYKFVSVSTLVDRMKINGSLARMAIRALENDGHIKRIVHSRSQLIYTRATAATD